MIRKLFVGALFGFVLSFGYMGLNESDASLKSAGGAYGVAAITSGTGLFDDGAVGTPSVAGKNSTTTGLYWTTNTLNGAAAGANVFAYQNGSAIFQGTWVNAPYTWGLGSGGAGNSNRAAMGWTFTSGLGTGSGAVGPFLFQVSPAGSSGTSVNAAVTVATIHNTKSITNNTGTAMVNYTLAANTVVAGSVKYVVEVFDGTDLQVEEGIATFHATNKGGVFANNTVVKFGNQQAATAGTLTATWTITAANPAVLTLNANSSLTPSAGYPRITYDLSNLTQQAIAIQ